MNQSQPLVSNKVSLKKECRPKIKLCAKSEQNPEVTQERKDYFLGRSEVESDDDELLSLVRKV